MEATAVSNERRRDLLSQQIQREVAQGARVESRGDYDAVMVQGNRVNHVLHLILSLITLGIWLIVWVIVSLTGGEKRSVVSVDEFGRVSVQGRDGGGGLNPLMIVAAVVVFFVLVALVSR